MREKRPKIVLILDNASIHKKTDIVDKIAENMPKLILEYLPEYSPDLTSHFTCNKTKNG